jgi:hypothetical protein
LRQPLRRASPAAAPPGRGPGPRQPAPCARPRAAPARTRARRPRPARAGNGRSGAPRVPPLGAGWCVDDHLFLDLPAAVGLIQSVTGAQQLHWIGAVADDGGGAGGRAAAGPAGGPRDEPG